ncbi:RHOMBOID-like protein 12, mitochondrial isoform X1 [Rosa rugosa]|uniref:RHOMBOID-like protein 12, mitochondrial isoform X1 n=1 Tax=Rosa rugosa TaxID=74645 RepID=UPI002B401BA9|nr:RHOMBOID-like protein 12, mitochondrial isoform X1 [Rosa rugosa]
MQRLLSVKLASNLPKNLSTSTTQSSSLFHFQPHKTFSLTKPPQTQTQNHFFSSFPTHPLPHQHNLTHKIHGFLSNPLLRKHFSLDSANTLLRVSSKRLSDCRLAFLQSKFPKQSFNFNPSRISNQSAWRTWLRRLSSGDMVLGLVVANVAVFLLWRIADPIFMYKNFTISLNNFTSGRLHTLITSAFSHVDIWHIISNMIGLYFFGINIGRTFGPEFLLKLYLAGAIGGSVFYLVHHAFLAASSKNRPFGIMDASNAPGLGASGAVNAIMLLDIFLHPTATLYLDFIIPVPAMLLGIFLIGKDILRIMEGNSQISGSAHLGGAAVAAIAWARLRKGRGLF